MNRDCKICGATKPPEAFSPTYRNNGSVRNQCRTCRNRIEWQRRKYNAPPRPPRVNDITRLAGHLMEPTVKNEVLAYIRQLDAPFALGEIWRPLNQPRQTIQRVLARLVKQDVLTREKFPITRRRWNIKILRFNEKETTRMEYLYRLAETAE